MSGSRVLDSGVGTAIEIASTSAQPRFSSVVASNAPLRTSAATSDAGTSWMCDSPAIRSVHDTLAHVVADHVESGLGELDGQRKTDVAQSDDADDGRPVLDALQQSLLS